MQINLFGPRCVDMGFFSEPPVPAVVTAHTARMKNLIDAAADASNFKKLLSAFKSASLIDMLRSPGKHTILAPTNADFHRMPAGAPEAMFKDARTLEPLFCNHMMLGFTAANA